MRFRLSLVSVVFVVSCLNASVALSTIIHVPSDQPTIQAGIDAAVNGDTVLVAPGTYTGDGNRDIDFQGKRLVVTSESGADGAVVNCEGTFENRHRGFTFVTGEDSLSILMGFTVRNGFGPNIGSDSSVGGGALIYSSSPRIEGCIFEDNKAADAGGAIYILNSSQSRILRCSFSRNTAGYRNGVTDDYRVGYGGAVRCVSSVVVMERCTYLDNSANVGGGTSAIGSTVVIDSCNFTSNLATTFVTFEPINPGAGGAIHCYFSALTLKLTRIVKNKAFPLPVLSYEGGIGGGVAASQSQVDIYRCTLFGNEAANAPGNNAGEGGGIFATGSHVNVLGTLIVYSAAGGAYWCGADQDSTSFTCSNLFANSGGDWESCIAMFEGTQGNLSLDPHFCDTSSGLSLSATSPCLAFNNSCGLDIGYTDSICSVSDVMDRSESVNSQLKTVIGNFPNPFNNSTHVVMELPFPMVIRVDILNILGKRVTTLLTEQRRYGSVKTEWDGRDAEGNEAASGVYIVCAVNSRGVIAVRKITLLR